MQSILSSCAACSIPPSIRALLQGQWISILIAGTGIFATILSTNRPNANFPLLMNLFNYLLLSLFLLRKLYRDRQIQKQQQQDLFSLASLSEDLEISDNKETVNNKRAPIYISRWLYFFAAILDVEANFLVLEAYNYTNITSIMLLDCFTIPCVMTLSYFLLGCRYRMKHGLGVVLCLIGVVCIVINDIVEGNSESKQHAIIGDLFCIGGSIFYATSNVVEETMVKFTDKDEYLGNLGGFGVIIALIQCMIVDLHGIERAHFTPEVILSMGGFILCLFFMYVNTTSFLQESDATLFNLSLLTSDVYAVIFTYFFQGYLVSWLYFVAFAFVLCGLLIYHAEKPPLQHGKDDGVSTSLHHPAFLTACMIHPRRSRSLPTHSSGSSGNKVRFEYNPIVEDSGLSDSSLHPTTTSPTYNGHVYHQHREEEEDNEGSLGRDTMNVIRLQQPILQHHQIETSTSSVQIT